ncbi:MAG TPA: 4-hydroxy-tetrahydrodipicolinate reductase [Verrucomicrobiae bacterium]|jgi:4-hydroxy-tetrahydrodipicolinate reductase|nr:4-hydroxy-tetrahydrodipicolinate reductase [Verrucomicrobiae bacterium]
MTKIIIAGAKGRMGQALFRCAEQIPEVSISGQINRGDDLRAFIEDADVVVDFSYHDCTAGFADICATHKKAMVIGTTGHTDAQRKELQTISARLPMVWTSNFSTGVNVLFWLTRKTAEILGPEYDLEIVEMHHRFKKDAPSGTARTLAQILADTRRQQLDSVLRHGREGLVGERAASEIGMHSIRGGDVVGDHTVIFATPGERVELAHKASSREAFANGALRAAQWVQGKKPGVYDMQDVLGLKA